MSHAKSEETRGNWLRRHAHLLVYAVAIGIGLTLGAKGSFGSGRLTGASSSTPLARVGFVLREPQIQASAEDWAELSADVEHVSASMNPEDRPVFELVVAARGLRNGGKAELGRAEQACRALRWARCDRAALEELVKRSRP